MNIGEKIKTIRLKKGETLEEFGEALGATKVSVHNWESGRNLPNKRRLKRIAELGNTTVEELTEPEPIDQLTERILKTYSKEQVQDIIVKLAE